MDHLADNTAKLRQGRENWYIGREGDPVDDTLKDFKNAKKRKLFFFAPRTFYIFFNR